MSYESVDALQQALAKDIFGYAKDKKKAAGRALGTLVEIVNFYMLKAWGLERHIAIERRVPEYANPDLTHNVEFTLHPRQLLGTLRFSEDQLPFTAAKIAKALATNRISKEKVKSNQLLTSKYVLRNACTIQEGNDDMVIACLGDQSGRSWQISVERLRLHPFAMFECKRVGVEDGVKKGPQTIEKAKQGAYVAGTVSSLQKIRMSDGQVYGLIHLPNDKLEYKPYVQFLEEVVGSSDASLLRHFMLTVGVVSNHGNWFTSDDHNKELRVLAQAYDWLLFLTDRGLSRFVHDLLLSPAHEFQAVKNAFIGSYTGERGNNKFTKVQIDLSADKALRHYFTSNLHDIENWFNVISPSGMTIDDLKQDLQDLCSKDWEAILK